MRKFYLSFILILSIFCLTAVSAQSLTNLNRNALPADLQTLSQPILQTTPVRTILNSDESTLILKYDFSGIKVSASNRKSENFQYLHIHNFPKMGEVGKPALPAHNDLVLVSGSSYQIEIIDAPYTEYKGFNIHPALEAASDEAGAPEPEFVKDNALYSTNAFWPNQIVAPVTEQKVRGMRYLVLQIRPVQFNPVTHTIRVYDYIKYKVSFTGVNNEFRNLKYRSSDTYINSLQEGVLNNNLLPKRADNSMKTSNSHNIILLTTPEFQAAADTLALWKRQLGYSVYTISLSNWTSAQVKDSVHTLYQSWTPHPDYLIILGDNEDVPAEQIPYSTTYYLSDLYYVCMDGTGDYTADMARGRISVSNATEAMTVVQKIVNYERNPVQDASFYSNVMSCGYFQDGSYYGAYFDGYADRRFLHTVEEVKSYLDGKNYNVSRTYIAYNNRNPQYYNNGYYSDGQAIPSDLLRSNGFNWDGDAAAINQKINAGAFLLYHRDHGFTDGYGWEHPYYLNSESNGVVNDGNHINQLNNGNKLPIVFSVNCHTGDFKRPECFAENFVRKSNAGAVGVIAPSYATYSGYNDAIMTGLIDAIWSNPGLVPDFGLYPSVANPNLNSHGDIRTMGHVLNQGLLRMSQVWAPTSRYQLQNETFHYFGDPSMRIWTSVPQTFSLNTLPSLIRLDSSLQISVSNCADAQYSLIVDGEIFEVGSLVNGQATIEFVLDSVHEAILTISGPNMRPYTKKITIDNTIKNVPPVYQASNIRIVQAAKSYAATIEWDKGDGDFSLVKISDDGHFTAPVNGIEYPADNTYTGSGEQVVFSGAGNTVEVFNLTEGEVYWFRVYEYNNEGVYTLYQTIMESDNPKASNDGGESLPVELSTFTAQIQNGKVVVNWVTSSEINNDYFILEHSVDNFSYSEIERQAGSANSNIPIAYQAIHNNPDRGMNYYRLKQVDFDGTEKTYESVSVQVNQGSTDGLISQVSSNNQQIELELAAIQSQAEIILADLSGRIIYNKKLEASRDGQRVQIPLDQASIGVYVISVRTPSNIENKKVVLK